LAQALAQQPVQCLKFPWRIPVCGDAVEDDETPAFTQGSPGRLKVIPEDGQGKVRCSQSGYRFRPPAKGIHDLVERFHAARLEGGIPRVWVVDVVGAPGPLVRNELGQHGTPW